MRCYLGADGGGTKTMLALFDETARMTHSLKIPGTNHENLSGGIPEAAERLLAGIRALLAEAGISQKDVTAALFALAGMDHPYQEDALSAELKKGGLAIPFTLCNDGFIVCKAGGERGAVIGYNCGTGTCCNSIDENGALLQVGGFGALSGDVGGGVWIAGEVFRMVYDDVCLGYRETACTALACKYLGIEADRAGVLSLVAPLEETEDQTVRALIDVFFEALNAGDPAALDTALAMAKRGAAFIAAHLRRGHFPTDPVQVVLSGSVHAKLPSQKYIGLLQREARSLTGRELRFSVLGVQPVYGCINWMLEKESEEAKQ